jgi:hypothetical protein
MPLRISCPEGHTLVVSQARAGQALFCPKCNARIVVPPPAPARNASLVDVAMSALVQEPQLRLLAADEPEPPPVVGPPALVVPPPVWTPPPKSRAIVETLPDAPPPLPDSDDHPASISPQDPGPGAEEVSASELPEAKTEITPGTEEVIPPRPQVSAEPATAEQPEDGEPARQESSPDVATAAPPRRSAEPAAADLAPQLAESDANPPLVLQASQQFHAYVLSLSLIAAALFGAAPAIWDFVQYLQAAEGAFVPRWALALLAIGVIQGAYAVYLAQLPDWTSGWIVTLVSLALAALYAGMLGITLLAAEESFLIRGLDLSESVPTGRAAMWCLCMTTILATLAFFAGRSSFRWKSAEAAAGMQSR